MSFPLFPTDQRYSNTWTGDGIPGQVYQALADLKEGTGALFSSSGALKIEESFIEPGDQIYVMGTADLPRSNFQLDSTSSIVIRKGTNNKFFCISDKSEKELLGSFRVKALFEIYGGAALCLGCVGIFVKLYLENLEMGNTSPYFFNAT